MHVIILLKVAEKSGIIYCRDGEDKLFIIFTEKQIHKRCNLFSCTIIPSSAVKKEEAIAVNCDIFNHQGIKTGIRALSTSPAPKGAELTKISTLLNLHLEM